MPEQDLRLYGAEETLRLWSRIEEERSILAKAVAALVADRPARERYLSNARSGGSALWIVAPTKERADRLVGLLADWRYVSMRYFGEDGWKTSLVTSADLPRRRRRRGASFALQRLPWFRSVRSVDADLSLG